MPYGGQPPGEERLRPRCEHRAAYARRWRFARQLLAGSGVLMKGIAVWRDVITVGLSNQTHDIVNRSHASSLAAGMMGACPQSGRQAALVRPLS